MSVPVPGLVGIYFLRDSGGRANFYIVTCDTIKHNLEMGAKKTLRGDIIDQEIFTLLKGISSITENLANKLNLEVLNLHLSTIGSKKS